MEIKLSSILGLALILSNRLFVKGFVLILLSSLCLNATATDGDPFSEPDGQQPNYLAWIARRTDELNTAVTAVQEIAIATRFELILLNPTLDYNDADKKENWVKAVVVDSPGEVLGIKASLLSYFDDEGIGAFCFFPVHELRAYRNETEVLRLIICWACSQSKVVAMGSTYGWQIGSGSSSLMEVFNEKLPIPEEYQDMEAVVKQKYAKPSKPE